MLDGYGHHQLTWDTCDERFGDVLVASPADAQGRGISLAVRQNGAAANLTASGKRGKRGEQRQRGGRQHRGRSPAR